MADDPYRFGFSAPGDEIPDVDPTDGFHRDSQGHWVEDGDSCDICFPPPRAEAPQCHRAQRWGDQYQCTTTCSDPQQCSAMPHMPYDPETDPF